MAELRLATILLLLTSAAGAAEASSRTWYQVEILLFANASATAVTEERLAAPDGARQAATAVALGPVWPAPVRPGRTEELEMIWAGAGAHPRVDRVTPGLDPETERLLRWLRRLDGRTRSPDLDWLYGLDVITWDAGDPLPRPVPEIAPEVRFEVVDVPAPLEPFGAYADAYADAEADADAEPPPGGWPVPLDLAFRRVERTALVLADEAARLRRARDFQVLEHLAWRQPFEAGAPAIPVAVRWEDPATGTVRLAGTVGVALRRYLHLEAALHWFEGEAPDERGEPVALWTPVDLARRMRSGETHYVDHPRIGALVRVTPFALDAPLEPDGPVTARLEE